MTDHEHLLAIELIKKLKSRYFRYMDFKQWDDLRQLFTADAVFDVRDALQPPDAISSSEPPIVGVDNIIRYVSMGLESITSVHHGHMPDINILADDRAEGFWSLEDWLYTPAGNFHGQGYYQETYVKEPHGWCIATLRIRRLYVRSEL